MDMRKLVGRNVKRVRQERGLTQEQLAELSGFSQQYISGLEQGRRNPTIVTIYALAVALHVDHMELLRPHHEESACPTYRPHPAPKPIPILLVSTISEVSG